MKKLIAIMMFIFCTKFSSGQTYYLANKHERYVLIYPNIVDTTNSVYLLYKDSLYKGSYNLNKEIFYSNFKTDISKDTTLIALKKITVNFLQELRNRIDKIKGCDLTTGVAICIIEKKKTKRVVLPDAFACNPNEVQYFFDKLNYIFQLILE